MVLTRKLTDIEALLIRYLIAKSGLDFSSIDLNELKVHDLADGGMGSLRLLAGAANENDRIFGSQIAEVRFNDADGEAVIVSLNVDTEGELLELDIWKTDFSPLIRFPDPNYWK